MPRKNFYPKETNWELDVDHPWTMAIHTNDMVVMNPQLDLDHPDDLDTQTTISIGYIREMLEQIGCGAEDITNIRVEYVNNGKVDEDQYRQSIVEQFGDINGAVIEMVPFDRLVLPELLVEICTYAMVKQDGAKIERVKANPAGLYHPGQPFSQGLRAGKMIYAGGQVPRAEDGSVLFAGDFRKQAEAVLANLKQVLAEFGATLDDLVRLNVFYDASLIGAEWAAFAKELKAQIAEPGPALTAIPLPRLYPQGTTVMICGWAMLGEDGSHLDKQHAGLEKSNALPGSLLWRHGVKCEDMVFVGGQAALSDDGSVIAPDDQIAQTKQTMDNIDEVLGGFDNSIRNLHKINSYYVLKTVEEFNSNLETRSEYFKKPGPGSVGLPLDELAVPNMKIEMEAILVEEK